MEWLNSLEPMLRIYWIIAGIASLVFVIQTILTFVGMDDGDSLGDLDADVDFDSDADIHAEGGFPVFSVRNLVNFCLGFGWGGVCFYHTFDSRVAVVLSALSTGVAFVVLFFLLIRMFLKLGRDNTFKITETLDQTADVYLGVPAGKSGSGKIQISVRGAVHELDALTVGEKIPTGGKARITEIVDDQTVMVAKI
ncbi:MAG: serine protease [Acidobacteriota bacterium]|jgi:hypothetical protein|nr:serine protease [Acidobacteriota bacterium]